MARRATPPLKSVVRESCFDSGQGQVELPDCDELTRIILDTGVKESTEFEKRFIARDGIVIWASVSVSAFQAFSDGQKYQVAQIQNVTSRKLAETVFLNPRRPVLPFRVSRVLRWNAR